MTRLRRLPLTRRREMCAEETLEDLRIELCACDEDAAVGPMTSPGAPLSST